MYLPNILQKKRVFLTVESSYVRKCFLVKKNQDSKNVILKLLIYGYEKKLKNSIRLLFLVCTIHSSSSNKGQTIFFDRIAFFSVELKQKQLYISEVLTYESKILVLFAYTNEILIWLYFERNFFFQTIDSTDEMNFRNIFERKRVRMTTPPTSNLITSFCV